MEADPLEVAAWRMAAGRLASEDLPEIAIEALVRGLDSPALRVLAGQARWDVRDSSDLFRVALDELGIELLDADRAQWQLATRTAGHMVTGRIGAARGANELWLAYQQIRDNGDLRIFVGLASTLDDHPEEVEHIEAAIIVAARELLDRPAPRRWIKLMAVRGRSPLTQTVSSDDIEIDPDTLQLGDGLRSQLAQWAAAFEATMSGWPTSGGFASEHDAERFVAAGQRLVVRLQDELGASYQVEYRPEPIRPPGVNRARGRIANQYSPMSERRTAVVCARKRTESNDHQRCTGTRPAADAETKIGGLGDCASTFSSHSPSSDDGSDSKSAKDVSDAPVSVRVRPRSDQFRHRQRVGLRFWLRISGFGLLTPGHV